MASNILTRFFRKCDSKEKRMITVLKGITFFVKILG